MKNFRISWIFILAILFASCSGGLTGDPYLDNQGQFLKVNDSLRNLAKEGYIVIDSSHAGNAIIQKVMVKIEPSTVQKIQITKKTGVFGWVVALCSVTVALMLFGIIYSSTGGRFTGATVWIFLLAIALIAGACGLVSWAHAKEDGIPKMTYDSLMRTPQGLKPYWDENLLK